MSTLPFPPQLGGARRSSIQSHDNIAQNSNNKNQYDKEIMLSRVFEEH